MKYRHYKGGIYEVLADVTHTESKKALVIYRSVEKPDEIWARPYGMFHGYLSGDRKRFELIEEE